MLEAVVEFDSQTTVRAGVYAVRRTNLHTHPGILEIVYVLRGDLHAMVSCEHFDLQTGDFAVINRDDPHLLAGSPDNVTAVVHVNLAAFRDIDPVVEHILFACESFDLARYRRQEELLRGLLLDLIGQLVVEPGQPCSAVNEPARELMALLCTGYSLESYYNRAVELSASRRERFRTVVRHLWKNAAERDVLDIIADRTNYSKSYVSHLVKDVAAVSFSDLLVYFRVAHAEKLLLSGDTTMLEVAAASGFSDVKYFTRSFVNWFHQSPAEYRRQYRRDVLHDNQIDVVSPAVVDELIRGHRRLVATTGTGPRLSVTPLLLKNLGSRKDLFEAISDTDPQAPTVDGRALSPTIAHLVPIRVSSADVDGGYLLDGLASFDQIHTAPCLVLEYSTKAATLALIAAIADRLPADILARPGIWLTYTTIHDRAGVEQVAVTARDLHRLAIQPILMP